MTASPTLELARTFQPGRCAVHGVELVTHDEAGLHTYVEDDPRRVVCPDPHHQGAQLDALRCTWCGGRLYPVGASSWSISDRKTYCTPRCRLRAFRAARRTSDA